MSHFITLTEAEDMTSRYRDNRNSILAEDYQDQDILPVCETFDREAFDTILEQEGCQKIRIYYGMEEDLKLHAIIVGVNGDDEDMLPGVGVEAVIVEKGMRCPPMCPPSSPLNS
ncbi:hypothetical protein JMG10_13440 [Nostoc ellipsosporum NOK]|jgi:hypothetical protein|nr:hypothetical protein [Nostoc ellipsosporum NOK]